MNFGQYLDFGFRKGCMARENTTQYFQTLWHIDDYGFGVERRAIAHYIPVEYQTLINVT